MKKNFLVVSLLVFIYVTSFAQTNRSIPVMPSVNAAELGKYGEWPVNYHHGLPQINIPIYTLITGELNLPISLSYHASGIKVDQEATWVGLGWSLNAGGVINWQVNEDYDFRPGKVEILTFDEADNGEFYSEDELSDINIHGDTETDIFSYNFAGYSGQFCFEYKNDEYKLVHLNNHEGLRILDNYFEWDDHEIHPTSGGICIVDKLGVKYYFDVLEKSTPSYSLYDFAKLGNQYAEINIDLNRTFYYANGGKISALYLSRIESVNGEHYIELEYESYSQFKVTGYSGNVIWHPGLDKWITKIEDNEMPTLSLNSNSISTHRLTKITSSDNVSVEFVLDSVKREDLCKSSDYALKKVLIKANEITIREIEFEYSYFQSSITTQNVDFVSADCWNKRLKLKSLSDIGEDEGHIPMYNFNYYGEGEGEFEMPFKYSFSGKDKFGYYNGDVNLANVNDPSRLFFNTTGVLPGTDECIDYTYDPNPFQIHESECLSQNDISWITGLIDDWKAMFIKDYIPYGKSHEFQEGSHGQFNLQYAVTNSLKEIVYPTGGKTIFEYEGSKYDNIGSSHYNLPSMEGDIIGLRIKKISNDDGFGNITNRDFVYSGFNGQEWGSGIIPWTFEFGVKWSRCYPVQETSECGSYGSRFLYFNTPNFLPPKVTYSHVREVIDNGYIDYFYTNYEFNEELNYDFRTQYNARYYGISCSSDGGVNSPGNLTFGPVGIIKPLPNFPRVFEEYSSFIGRNYKTEFYDKTGRLLKMVRNNYSYDIEKYIFSMIDIGMSFGDYYNRRFNITRIPAGKSFLQNTQITHYFPNQPDVVQTTTYEYDEEYELLLSESTNTSSGKSFKKEYKYPISYSGNTGDGAVLEKMREKNMIAYPIELTQSIDDKVTASEVNQYQVYHDSLIKLSSHYYAKIQNPVPVNSFAYYNGESINDAYVSDIEIEKYDHKGNVLQYRRRGDHFSTSIIWGSQHRKPIAKIENMTYDDFMNNNGGYELNELQNMSGSQQIYVFNLIRNLPYFKEARITSYAYYADLKLESITDANGKTLSHEYDGFNRLETTFHKEFNEVGQELEKHVLQHIDYHYKQN